MCQHFLSCPSDWLKQPAEHLPDPETDKSEAKITQHQYMYNLWLDLIHWLQINMQEVPFSTKYSGKD